MKRFSLLLALICPLLTLAQSNFKPGSIVTLAGDTVRGYVDYQEWESSPKAVSFKKSDSNTEKPKRYLPQQIRFFRVDNLEAYQSYSGRISMDDTNIQHLNREKDTSYIIDNVFLKQLVTGPYVNMYAYTDYKKTRFFVEQAGQGPVQELVFRIYMSIDAMTPTVYDNGYMQQLFLIAEAHNKGTDQMKAEIERSEYRADKLTAIVNHINGISHKPFKRTTNTPKPYKLYAGIGANMQFYNTFGHYADLGGGAHTSTLPKGTIGIMLFANPNTQRAAFRVEASVAAGKYQSSYSIIATTTANTNTYKVAFNQLTYSFSPQVTYNIYNANNFKFYVGAGIGFNFYAIKDKLNPNPDLFVYGTYDTAAIVRTGVILSQHVNIDFQYLTTTTLTRVDNYGIETNAIQLGVNYLF
jgi:hypothetical protein